MHRFSLGKKASEMGWVFGVTKLVLVVAGHGQSCVSADWGVSEQKLHQWPVTTLKPYTTVH